ncbi:MAG: hypothetical protein QG662_1631 [Pseudomonadota bacterium]|nr:hypothetical protein [Pseudomonadota bacterium]
MDVGIESKPSARAARKLTDMQLKAFVATAAPGKKMADGSGLYITITNAGNPTWRVNYRIAGKQKVYSIGLYPDVTLEGARAELQEVRALVKEGKDPVTARRLTKADNLAASGSTFATLADDWLGRQKREWSEVHYTKSRRALERDVLPYLGKLPVAEITPAMVAGVVERIAKRTGDTAGKILQHVGSIFRLAQARGLRLDNPATPARELIPKKKLKGRMPALVEFVQLGDVLRRANMARLSPTVRVAHRLIAFTAARISNAVEAEWKEFTLDGESPQWLIPRTKMKAQDRHHDHRILLSPQIVAELKAWQTMSGTKKGYLFPGAAGGNTITRESIEKAYRVTLQLDRKHTPHGWRSALSTLARDAGFSRDVVELALDHIHDTDVALAYDRGERLVERRRMMDWWGAELYRAERGADVVPIMGKTAA